MNILQFPNWKKNSFRRNYIYEEIRYSYVQSWTNFVSCKLKTPRPNWHYPTPKHRGGQKATAVWLTVIQKKDPVFVINISSCSHKFTSLERKWDKKKSSAILQNFDSWMIFLQKSHLALGDLAKLVFCSISSIKNRIFEKLFSFSLSQFHL